MYVQRPYPVSDQKQLNGLGSHSREHAHAHPGVAGSGLHCAGLKVLVVIAEAQHDWSAVGLCERLRL